MQFQQYYQQNYLSPQTIKHKKTITYANGNPGPGLGQAQKMAGLNQLMGSQLFFIIGSPTAIDTHKQ